MKKYIFPIFVLLTLIVTVLIMSATNAFTNQKVKEIYLDNFVITKLLANSQKNDVNFKTIYPNGVDLHEYQFTQQDQNNFKHSLGVYYIDNNQNSQLKHLNNSFTLNHDLKKELLTLDDKSIDNIHYVLSLKSTQKIYNKLVKKFKIYIDTSKVALINNKFNETLKNLNLNSCANNVISVHNAWNYFNFETKANVKSIGDHEGNIISNSYTNDILNNIRPNSKLLTEKYESLTTNETKLIQKFSLIDIKIDTFERELKNLDEYFKFAAENYKLICN